MFAMTHDLGPSGIIPGILAVLLWCFTGVCFAAGSRLMGPMPYTTAICVVGLMTGVAVQGLHRRPIGDLFRIEPRVWMAGFFGVSVYTVVLILAVGIADDSDVAQVVLVNYLWPLMIILIGALFPTPADRQPGGSGRMLALAGALGFTGVAMARGPESLLRPPHHLIAHGLAFVAAMLWAAYSVLLRRWRVPEARNGSTAQWACCAVLAALVGWIRGEWSAMPALGWSAAGWALFCGIGPVGLAYHWWEIGIKRGPVQSIAVLSFFIPIGSAALMGALFREALSPYLIPGATLIAIASAIVQRTTLTPTVRTEPADGSNHEERHP